MPAKLKIDPESQVAPLFATPVALLTVPDHKKLNPAIEKAILAEAHKTPGMQRSNVGGWHSELNLLHWPVPEIRQLAEMVADAATHFCGMLLDKSTVEGKLSMHAWANVCRRGNYHRAHCHPNWHISAAYYVNAGKPVADKPNSGSFEFLDPRAGSRMQTLEGTSFGRPHLIYPESGQLLLFPSWMEHAVNAYQGSGHRISIAFNMRFAAT